MERFDFINKRIETREPRQLKTIAWRLAKALCHSGDEWVNASLLLSFLDGQLRDREYCQWFFSADHEFHFGKEPFFPAGKLKDAARFRSGDGNFYVRRADVFHFVGRWRAFNICSGSRFFGSELDLRAKHALRFANMLVQRQIPTWY